MWYVGSTAKVRSGRQSMWALSMAVWSLAAATTLRWEIIAHLALPVVPDEYTRNAVSLSASISNQWVSWSISSSVAFKKSSTEERPLYVGTSLSGLKIRIQSEDRFSRRAASIAITAHRGWTTSPLAWLPFNWWGSSWADNSGLTKATMPPRNWHS
jgi:hypothetical protein